jgi:catechol 2,3-dioxygenase-like lactoylglutathione lyase family enzyme
MFSHLTIGTNDLTRACAFYDAVLAPLGIERVPSKYQKWAAWQRPGEAAKLWVGHPSNGLPASWGNGWMAAFTAPSRPAVDAAYAAALANGAYDEGAPGLRP